MSRKQTAPGAVAATTEAKDEETGTPSQTMVADSVTDRARRRMRRARLWVEDNPGAFSYMKSEAQRYAESGRRFGMQELAEWVRRSDFTDCHGMPTKINNTIVPPLARILIEQHPECRPYIELRTRAYDGLAMGDDAR